MSVRGSLQQLRQSREGGMRRSLIVSKNKNQSTAGILMSERGGTARSSRKSIQFDANEQIANLKKQKRLFGETAQFDFASDVTHKFAPQPEKGQFQFKQIDQLMQDDPTYAEPEFIKQHRDEFEMFLITNRPDLNRNEYHEEQYMQLHAPLMKTLSPISTYYVHKRCPRYIRNFGSSVPQMPHQEYASTKILVQDYKNGQSQSPQKFQMPSIDNKNFYKNGTQLFKPTGGNILLSSQSSLMQSYTKLLTPTIDKDKLRQELNQLVAYRHRKLLILQKLEADLSQIKFTNSQANVFVPTNTFRNTAQNSPKNKVCCSSPGDVKSPTKMLMYSTIKSQKKSLGMTLSNMETFSQEMGFRSSINNQEQKQAMYSRKSQFGQNSVEILEQNKNVQATTMPDDFSIVDMEFRKVQLQMKIRVKERELDEAVHENQTLNHHLAKEKHQNLLNKKSFNELLPSFEEYEAMGYKFQHIESLNYFRKFVAEHTLKEKLEELTANHSDHEYEITQLLEQLRNESQLMHVSSVQLQSRELELEQKRQEIRQIRLQTANLGNIKKQWVSFLRIRYREYRIIKILRIFYLIAKLKDESNQSMSGGGSVFHSMDESRVKKTRASNNSLDEAVSTHDDQRTEIFNELQSLLVKFTQMTDFRAFCNQVLISEMPDLIKFFEEDAIYESQYKEVHDKLNEQEVTIIYNQSQFAIASLQGTHENLMHNKEKKKAQIIDLKKLRSVLSEHQEDLVDYLACANIAERNELDLTVDDMFKMREIQTKYLCQSKQTLMLLIPQVRSLLAHSQKQVAHLESIISNKIQSENMISTVGNFLIGAISRPQMEGILISVAEDMNNDLVITRVGGGGDEFPNSHLSSFNTQNVSDHSQQIDLQNQTYQKSVTQSVAQNQLFETGGVISNRKQNLAKKQTTLAANANLVKAKTMKIGSERPASNLVAIQPNIDFNDKNQVEIYLGQQTMDSLELLSKLGGFMKKCETALIRLQNDLNSGNPIKIDYSHYERQFHETHYMKTLAMNSQMQRDRFSNSSSTTPFGGQVASVGGSKMNSPQSVHFHSDVDLMKDRNHHLQTQQSAANRPTDAGDDDLPTQKNRHQQSLRNSLKTQGGGTYNSRGTTSGGSSSNVMNSNIEQRGIFGGSDLMNEKFKRVRNLQQFELRERQFLRQFKKRIHESYFSNN